MKKILTKILPFILIIFSFFTVYSFAVQDKIQDLTGQNSKISFWTKKEETSFYDTAFNFFIDFLYFIWNILLIILILYLIVKFIRLMFELYKAKDLVYLKITLPKKDSKLDKEQETKKDFKEKMGMMWMFYKAIHKLSEAWFTESVKDWFFKFAKVSLELVYEDGEITFYAITYKAYRNLVRQHITSIYNDAEIIEIEKKDYINLKPKWYTMRAASLSKDKDDVYPIRTYKYLEDDPLNNFTNVFSSLDKTDKAVFQITISPASDKWNKKAIKASRLVAKWEYKKKSKWWIFRMLWKPFWFFFNPLVLIFQGPDAVVKSQDEMAPWASEWDAYKIFNQAETEAQKIMWESAAQPIFYSAINVFVSSKNPKNAENWVHAVVAAASIFTDEYNNSLDNPQFFEDVFAFIVTPIRYFSFVFKLNWFLQDNSYFSADELITLYHLPDINYNRSSIIKWLEYKKLPPPHNLKIPKIATILDEKVRTGKKDKNWKAILAIKKVHRTLGWFPVYKDWVLMWWNEYRGKKTPIYFDRKDRWRHHYVLWKSGWGKSVFIGYLARQDLRNNEWLAVIDPHGDLVEDVLSFAPKHRAKDIVIFDPADDEMPMGLNILEVISTEKDARAREMDRAALDATEIFIKIFGDEIFGPRIQHYFRNGCLTLMEDLEEWGTLIDVPRLFTDEAFLKYRTRNLKNPVVKSFWEHEYANTWDREKQEMIPYFSSKFWPFITNTTIRNIIGQPKSAFNIRQIMDNQRVLLVNLSKGKIWALNAQLLWLIFVSKVNMAAMSRADMPEDERKEFFMYVDEFQNFATEAFGEILSEARKYRLALIMAHQFIAQIWGNNSQKWDKPSIKDAVFWNVWTMQSFKVGADDAEYLAKEYAPTLSEQDIIWIANFTTYVKLNIDNASSRPFDMKTIWDNKYQSRKAWWIIKQYSRMKYGRKKKFVDMEIEARLGMT